MLHPASFLNISQYCFVPNNLFTFIFRWSGRFFVHWKVKKNLSFTSCLFSEIHVFLILLSPHPFPTLSLIPCIWQYLYKPRSYRWPSAAMRNGHKTAWMGACQKDGNTFTICFFHSVCYIWTRKKKIRQFFGNNQTNLFSKTASCGLLARIYVRGNYIKCNTTFPVKPIWCFWQQE